MSKNEEYIFKCRNCGKTIKLSVEAFHDLHKLLDVQEGILKNELGIENPMLCVGILLDSVMECCHNRHYFLVR